MMTREGEGEWEKGNSWNDMEFWFASSHQPSPKAINALFDHTPDSSFVGIFSSFHSFDSTSSWAS